MKYQYEPLSDEYEFQTFLKDLFNAIYRTDSFEEYGSKGMKQYGIDVYSPVLKIGIQAKKKDLNRSKVTLKKELESELLETLELIQEFPHELRKFYFATTTNRLISLQDICMAHSTVSDMSAQVFSWIDIQSEIGKYSAVRDKYYPFLKKAER